MHTGVGERPIRIAVLWTGLSGYLAACLRQLQKRNVRLLVAHSALAHDAPYAPDAFRFFDESLAWLGRPDAKTLVPAVDEFKPEAILAVNWHLRGYRGVLKRFPRGVPRILCMDNAWVGSAKQWLGVLTSAIFIRGIYDAAWVPGERQAECARRLGFPESRIFRGMYCCDFEPFADVYAKRVRCGLSNTERFLFTGRFVEAKGIETLMSAYAAYRRMTPSPWPLQCCGTGPLEERLRGAPGVELPGFVQPGDLPDMFSHAGCLVLPSLFEPWGVVVHEAAAAGLPILASTAVGSGVHLVQDGYNGFVFAPGDAATLSRLMLTVSAMGVAERSRFGAASHSLAGQFTPERWADYLLAKVAEMRGGPAGHEEHEIEYAEERNTRR